ncbi:hypothetical protein GCM10010917_37820 [Paenibacillus physcomitrellae]|uniref:D-alanyl-D-alanine carboxypeptidase-like core domain-containing protein n=1 Tax=Paenibacillus physcomitrellae TaxID=1619311 RepID=A0ABQ1GRY1_9BACL|nr:M15 family metallopeptidase [Paenibacillus physcomitrellae]GGA48965.1 hypothetical protein GCM10010917_37820 [Paenibacillus physcomitrellae]
MKKRAFLILILLLAGIKGVLLLKQHAESLIHSGVSGAPSAAQETRAEQAEPRTSAGAGLSADQPSADQLEGDQPAGNQSAAGESGQVADEQTLALSADQLYKGDLILVNQEHKLHKDGVMPDIVKLSEHPELRDGYGLLDDSIKLSASITEHFSMMVEAARKDGVNHFLISSGYRDFDKQDELYNQMGSDSALPAGYSEHNSGKALDIGSTEQQMSQAPEGKWLKKNAWKYGFILRYPEDKTAITGIKYEPWHFRYVGLPHSAVMQEKNLTLEEYLDYIREQQQIKVNVEGTDYEILYIPATQKKVQIPNNRGYTVSGDNNNGYIVTLIL